MKRVLLALLLIVSTVFVDRTFLHDHDPPKMEATAGYASDDGYRFIPTSPLRKRVEIRVVFYETPEQLQRAWPGRPSPEGMYVKAFSLHDDDECEMHVPDPRTDYQPASVGHEFLHCMFGSWHEEVTDPSYFR